MIKNKQNLPIYVLSASLIFFGLSVSINGANAATTSTVSVAEFNKLKNQVIQLRSCVSRNFLNIGSYDPETNWTALDRVTPCG